MLINKHGIKKLIPNGKERDRNQRLSILLRDDKACVYCGTSLSLETMTLDHKIPRALGGSDAYNNLVSCCYTCNHTKGSLTIKEFKRKLK